MDAHITRFCAMFPSADPAVISMVLESSFPPLGATQMTTTP